MNNQILLEKLLNFLDEISNENPDIIVSAG